MIVHIEKTLNFSEAVDASATAEERREDAQHFTAVSQLCKNYSVAHTLTMGEARTFLSISPQKITLDEFAMNDLFANVLSPYFEIEIRYMALGGKGCDMALAVTTSVEYRC